MKMLMSKLLLYLEEKKGIVFTRSNCETLLGKEYRVIKGTIRKTPDYDDAWLLALAKEATVIFDIGCNIGQSALLMMLSDKVKKIILVDPNPMSLSQAAQNLITNNLSQRACYVCAFVSDQPNVQVEFYTIGPGAAGSMFSDHAKSAYKANSHSTVHTTTIDHLVEQFNILPDFVKIDVEGAESLVLNGARALAAKSQTSFFVEMHSNVDLTMHQNAQKIIKWCSDNRYQAWYLKEKQPLHQPDQIAHRGRCHLLLIPYGETFPDQLMPLKQSARIEEVNL